MSIEISVEHLVAHVHIQNDLAESFIKNLQLIAKPLLMRTKLPLSVCGHVILHVASLVCIKPTTYHKYSSLQLAYGHEPNFFHLRIFFMCNICSNCSTIDGSSKEPRNIC